MSLNESQCTVLLNYFPISTTSDSIQSADLIQQLESKDDLIKIEALKQLISGLLSGEQYPKSLMSVIKYCLHSNNNVIKKLLLLYWEVVQKRDKNGQMLHEMILVCNAIKNNLTSPNEYIRGVTLRFLCKIKENEILESLIPSIISNLSHRHSYVRKNVILTIYSIYDFNSELIPDAPELIENFLLTETNPAAKRNAFLILFQCDHLRAVNYLSTILSTITTLSESFQLCVLELIRRICKLNSQIKSEYIPTIISLVSSSSPAVSYEAANTLINLTVAPTAIKAAVNVYLNLLQRESDNNVKLIILKKIYELSKISKRTLSDMLMDLLTILQTPNLDVKRNICDLILLLVNKRNISEVVQFLKKELNKTETYESGNSSMGVTTTTKSNELIYRKLLISTLHQCAISYPEIVENVVNGLLPFIGDSDSSSSLDVIYFIREIIEENTALRSQILKNLGENFASIRQSDVYRVTLWIIGEYSVSKNDLENAIELLKTSIGPLPLTDKFSNATVSINEEQKQKESVDKQLKKPIVLSDGTYASETQFNSPIIPKTDFSPLRNFLLSGDYFLASALCSTLTKVVLKYADLGGNSNEKELFASIILIFVNILRLGSFGIKPIDPDSHSRITLCIRTLLSPELGRDVFSINSKEIFATILKQQRKNLISGTNQLQSNERSNIQSSSSTTIFDDSSSTKQVDELIKIPQLSPNGNDSEIIDQRVDDVTDLNRAIGINNNDSMDRNQINNNNKLNRIYQLTGFSDPIYCEGQLNVIDYDIVIELLIINQSNSILQNVSVEISTSGDLRLVERPQNFNLSPNETRIIRSTIKLSSTEAGIIFGNIVYDSSNAGLQKNLIVLSNIHLDIQDYISPYDVSDTLFRSMWAEFEWENKVAVSTDITSLEDYLNHILSITNMKCLTAPQAMSGECNFLAANLYAKSIFNEDALLNLSIEKQKNFNGNGKGKINGYIRIRSKTQGIALSLGDKITAKQRKVKL